MKLLFQDESGDLGFDFSKQKTSRFFVITAVLMDEGVQKGTEKAVKEVFRKYAKPKAHPEGVLHATKETPTVRRKLLQEVAERDVSVYAVVLNKERVKDELRKKPAKLYNYVSQVLLKYICNAGKLDAVGNRLVASRRETKRLLNDDFSQYLETQIGELSAAGLTVCIASPYEEKCLQVADCVCWSIYRAVEHGDDSYKRLLRPTQVKILPLFFENDKTSCAL